MMVKKRMGKARILLLFLAAVIVVFAFVGCGGGITSSSLDGYWIVEPQSASDKDLKEKGVFTVYQFEGENTFRLILQVRGVEDFVREGAYEIRNGKVYVNLPETSVGSGTVSAHGEAIENAEITVNGETLKTTAIATNGAETIANKVTDAQYQEEVAAAAALGPQKVSIGESITTTTAVFTVDSMAFVDEIYPSDTSDYYTYMSKQDGQSYLLASVTYMNPATEYEVPGYATQASFSVGGNTYEAEIEIDAGPRFGPSYRVEAKETSRMYIYCLVPDAVKDAGEVKLTWSIPNEQSYMTTYYRSSYPHDEFSVAM